MPDPHQDERDELNQVELALSRGLRVPLAAALLGVVLVVALAPLSLFSLLTGREMKESLVTAQEERQLHLASAVAQRLDDFCTQAGRETVRIGEALATFSSGERDIAAPYLGGFLDDSVALVRFLPASGGDSSTAIKSDLALPSAVEQAMNRDAQMILDQSNASPAAALPAASRAAVLGGPYTLGPERVLAITVSAPVQRHGRLLGVFQEVALFDRVWRDAATVLAPSMRLFLLRPDGSVAAGVASGVGDDNDQSIRQREIVQQFLRVRGRSRGATAYEVTDHNGVSRRLLGSFAGTSQSWGVLVEVDEKLALAPVGRLRRLMTYGGVLAAALAVVAALLLHAVISRPITRLAHISRRLADGDFSVQAQPSPVAELEALAANYNRMAGRLGALIEHSHATSRDTNDMFLGAMRALAEAIDEKDPYTKGHSVRVNKYAVVVGRYLGLSREEMRWVQISSLLHDVGKIGIDDAILKKPAALSPEEYEVMKTHPERGAKIMARIPQLKKIIPGMRFHHERFGGGGYPKGLRRDEIPLIARIIAVADVFDAMITERPYQKACPVAEAVARINDMKGKALDPQVVEAFNRAFEAGDLVEATRGRHGPAPGDAAHDAEPASHDAEPAAHEAEPAAHEAEPAAHDAEPAEALVP